MTVSRLAHIPGIGVDKVGDAADAAADPDMLRLENLDTDIPPPAIAREATRAAIDRDDDWSLLEAKVAAIRRMGTALLSC